ncbi:MAG: 2-oxoacid:acceptor oxidoreductase family protein, partial [Proteobacteria bacterium]|nr:2-oxoacid:acceptor oxidoreductase family protein [Pseudomonadota bacterium]
MGNPIPRQQINEHIVEIVSDSGEGAQKAGQTFGNISAKMGNGVWTVEIIPAEIKPPARSPAGASGIRIRLGSQYMTNMGDAADIVVALNEQVLYSRIATYAYKKGTVILLESKWLTDPNPKIVEQYKTALQEFRDNGLIVHEIQMEEECLKLTPKPRLGKNMFVLGMLCYIYDRDVKKAYHEIENTFIHKGSKIIELNQQLFQAGYDFAGTKLDFHYNIPPWQTEDSKEKMIVTSGNQALGLGVMASGMDMVAMYP